MIKEIIYGILHGHTDIMRFVIILDSKCIVSGGDNSIRIWSIVDKRQESVLRGHAERVIA